MAYDWAKPRWWWIVLFVVAVAAVAIPLYVNHLNREADIARQDKQHLEDLAAQKEKDERAEKEAVPRLEYESGTVPETGGRTPMKYRNKSLSRKAHVNFLSLTISDPIQLGFIARYHPKPKEQKLTAPVDKREFRLIRGAWQGDKYMFFVYPDYEIPPDTAQIFDTCIVDPLLPSRDFTGVFDIELYEGTGDIRESITIRSRRQ